MDINDVKKALIILKREKDPITKNMLAELLNHYYPEVIERKINITQGNRKGETRTKDEAIKQIATEINSLATLDDDNNESNRNGAVLFRKYVNIFELNDKRVFQYKQDLDPSFNDYNNKKEDKEEINSNESIKKLKYQIRINIYEYK